MYFCHEGVKSEVKATFWPRSLSNEYSSNKCLVGIAEDVGILNRLRIMVEESWRLGVLEITFELLGSCKSLTLQRQIGLEGEAASSSVSIDTAAWSDQEILWMTEEDIFCNNHLSEMNISIQECVWCLVEK